MLTFQSSPLASVGFVSSLPSSRSNSSLCGPSTDVSDPLLLLSRLKLHTNLEQPNQTYSSGNPSQLYSPEVFAISQDLNSCRRSPTRSSVRWCTGFDGLSDWVWGWIRWTRRDRIPVARSDVHRVLQCHACAAHRCACSIDSGMYYMID